MMHERLLVNWRQTMGETNADEVATELELQGIDSTALYSGSYLPRQRLEVCWVQEVGSVVASRKQDWNLDVQSTSLKFRQRNNTICWFNQAVKSSTKRRKYIGRIIDVENLGIKQPTNPAYKAVNKRPFYWVLNALDKESGEPRTHREEMPTKMTP